MKKIMVIFGTRPEAIKMAPLVKELEQNSNLEPNIVITAQHREMLDSVLKIFDIQPHHDLNIMKKNQSLAELTSRALTKLDEVIKEEQPDMILVHGDTTTTFVGGLAAFYNQIPVGHVEAGLRTGNKYSPFPEEINRLMVGNMAELNFSHTQKSAENLLKESKDKDSIFITGNTAIDALNTTIKKDYDYEIIEKYKDKQLILLTAHRRENIGEPMENIFKAVRDIVDEYSEIVVVYLIHRNPKVREIASKYLENHDRIELIEPLDVLEFHNFANQSYLILTDSGGVQEEAPSLGKPVLVLRDNTERPEGVKAGTLKVIGKKYSSIYNETKNILDNKEEYSKMSKASNPYGDGKTSKRICDIIEYYFGFKTERPKDFH